MAGRGREYREKRRKTVEAPSGDEFTIRKPGAKTLSKLFKASSGTVVLPEDIEDVLSEENLEETAKQLIDEQSVEEIITSTDTLIINCVIDPKIVPDETDNDNELWIEDIDMVDYFFLSKEIAEFAGVALEKLRDLFRDLGRTDRSASGNDSVPSETAA